METGPSTETALSARAVFFVAPRSVEIRSVELEPEPPNREYSDEGEPVLVRSRLAAISSGTELLFFRGRMPERIDGETLAALGETAGYPLAYGYMNVGVTTRGERVFAFQPHQDRFRCNREELVPIPDDLRDEDAVLLPSVETALSIVHDAAPLLGDRVAVFGLGVIGLLVCELLLRCGIREPVAIDPIPERRERATTLGCTCLSPSDLQLDTEISKLTEGRGLDVAVNTSGNQTALQTAIDAAAQHGTVVEASWYGSTPVQLQLGEAFHRRRLTIKSSQVSRVPPALSARWDKPRRLQTAMELCRELRPSKHITHRFALEDAQGAFELLDTRPELVLQIVLEMPD